MAQKSPDVRTTSKLDRFAGMIADGIDVSAAGARLGMTPEQANAFMQRLRQRCGDQGR